MWPGSTEFAFRSVCRASQSSRSTDGGRRRFLWPPAGARRPQHAAEGPRLNSPQARQHVAKGLVDIVLSCLLRSWDQELVSYYLRQTSIAVLAYPYDKTVYRRGQHGFNISAVLQDRVLLLAHEGRTHQRIS